jgi:hypothetical protein
MPSGYAASWRVILDNKIKKLIKKMWKILLAVLLIFIGSGYYNVYLSKYLEEKNIGNALKKYAIDLNTECPYPIGENMIMEKVFYIEKKAIRYEFRLINGNKDEFDLEKLKENLSELMVKIIEETETFKKIRNKNVVFEHIFFDNHYEEMFKTVVIFNTPLEINIE